MSKNSNFVKSAFYTGPDNQSVWLYHWWLVGRVKLIMLSPFQVTHKNDTSQLNIVERHWRSVSDGSDVDRMHGFVDFHPEH
ncbi:rab geranylgeranyltransferase alpha subunit [Gigaspora margarita]|uniref:Rab geranylgeranyltransferase alpha subunit n=1 Tax=Gigaspora margarita TaxID=4874 RepID=A0A8H4AUM4_GIGMA|nr:rab geranylgeranyltransferase alpha subunit [Gigaspora margarita]